MTAPGFAPAHQFLAEALSAAGRHDEAAVAARRATALEPTSALMHGVEGLVLQAAGRAEVALAALGRTEEALRELELGPIAEEAEYFLHYRGSPAFDSLRDDPRFQAVYARYGL